MIINKYERHCLADNVCRGRTEKKDSATVQPVNSNRIQEWGREEQDYERMYYNGKISGTWK